MKNVRKERLELPDSTNEIPRAGKFMQKELIYRTRGVKERGTWHLTCIKFQFAGKNSGAGWGDGYKSWVHLKIVSIVRNS